MPKGDEGTAPDKAGSDAAVVAEATTEKASPRRPRGPGRPRSAGNSTISRATILRTAYKMSRTIPLQEISVVLVSREMKVTPALIHYYIGSRDWLTSGVMNLFYRDLVRKWPALGTEWRDNLKRAAEVAYAHFTEFSGIAAYAVSNNRFRVFQLTAFGDRDFGVETLELFAACLRSAGRPGDRTGIYAHLLREFIINSAHSTARHMYPSEYQQFLREKIDKLDPQKFPNIFFAGSGPAMLDAKAAFDEGVWMFIAGLERDPGSD